MNSLAKPRPALPMMPEGQLACWRFNAAADPAPLLSIGVRTVESWSGHALLQIPANEPALLALPATTADGKTNLPTAAGTIRLWYAPVDWSSTGAGGNGPGTEAVLWTVGAWSDKAAVGWYSLSINAAGTAMIFRAHGAGQPVEILSSSIEFCAGDWHQLALAWSEKESVLFIDGEPVAKGPGGALVPLTKFEGTPGFCIGSGVYGTQSACGMIEETIIFSRVCNEAELKGDWQRTAPVSARGPISQEEEAQWWKMAEAARAARALAPAATPQSSGHESQLLMMGDCASELAITRGQGSITLTIINAAPGKVYDLFRTFHLQGDSIAAAHWQKVGSGVNGNTFTFPNQPCSPGFYVLGCDLDTDEDGLTDAFEMLVNKTSPTSSHTLTPLFTDLELVNVRVNSPEEDCGNEQNSQFESTCAGLNGNVIVAYVDSNQGVYELGHNTCECLFRAPRLVGYAVSTDDGSTFEDKGVPPLCREGTPVDDDGDAGDPVLAVDRTSQVVYLAGTSPRNAGHKGIPLWKSTDGGVSFGPPTIVGDSINFTDKPWIAVDNGTGTGQHDVYLTFSTRVAPFKLWLMTSINGDLNNWTPLLIREADGISVSVVQSAIPVIGADHIAYVFWLEQQYSGSGFVNSLKVRKVENRGTSLGTVQTVRQLVTTDSVYGNLNLKRSNGAASGDTFRVFPFPVSAINPSPSKANHLYVAYADKGENPGDKADIFFVSSANGGTSWTTPFRVNGVAANDQWMPVLAVKPDGTKLFMAWYDRRNDPNNSLIDVFGRWATIAADGSVTLGAEFRISTVSFPPDFAGTLADNKTNGHYDPVYPPDEVNLHWWYPEWPEPPSPPFEHDFDAFGTYKDHVGEYNGAWAEGQHVYITWTDYRLPSVSTLYGRNQSDIRFVRITWPQ